MLYGVIWMCMYIAGLGRSIAEMVLGITGMIVSGITCLSIVGTGCGYLFRTLRISYNSDRVPKAGQTLADKVVTKVMNI